MTEMVPAPGGADKSAGATRLRRRLAIGVGSAVVLWLVTAYLLMPTLWRHYSHRHPAFDDLPNLTRTGTGIPGDPLNVALVGTEGELKQIMRSAGWHLADPLGLRSDLEIAAAAVLKRPDESAPVSNLYLFGRKEDLAFEQQVGASPRQRHHVRFWRGPVPFDDGRPLWLGSAVYDRSVGFSRTTGQITHHTAADIDTERDYLLRCLQETGALAEVFFIDDFHEVRQGRNGGGDPWHTDGRLAAGVIKGP